MKKVALLFFILLNGSLLCFAQYSNDAFNFGIDIGYSQKGYMPVGLYVGINDMQYGLSIGAPLNVGTSGEHYSTINWDEYPEDIVGSGEYNYPFIFSVARRVYDGLFLGAGIGFAPTVQYRNMYDNFHILGNNGSYHITNMEGNKMEYLGFISYHFAGQNNTNFFVKAFYSDIMGIGASFGTSF